MYYFKVPKKDRQNKITPRNASGKTGKIKLIILA